MLICTHSLSFGARRRAAALTRHGFCSRLLHPSPPVRTALGGFPSRRRVRSCGRYLRLYGCLDLELMKVLASTPCPPKHWRRRISHCAVVVRLSVQDKATDVDVLSLVLWRTG